MREERIEAYTLLAEDIDADAHGREDAHELGAHRVREGHAGLSRVREHGLGGLLSNNRFGGQGVVGHDAARVGLARERVVVEGVVDRGDAHVSSDEARKVREPAHPRVELGRAIV